MTNKKERFLVIVSYLILCFVIIGIFGVAIFFKTAEEIDNKMINNETKITIAELKKVAFVINSTRTVIQGLGSSDCGILYNKKLYEEGRRGIREIPEELYCKIDLLSSRTINYNDTEQVILDNGSILNLTHNHIIIEYTYLVRADLLIYSNEEQEK